jgi:hypothetical protein
MTVHYGGEGVPEPVELGAFRVRRPQLELQNPRMNEELLRRMAESGGPGGEYLPPSRIGELPDRIQPNELVVPTQEQIQLFDAWPLFALFMGLILVEWIWRKRARML